MYRLFLSLRSPFARRIRLAFLRLKIPFEPEELNVFEPTERFLNASPLGLAPVLELPNGGGNVPDSATILEFLHDNHGQRIWPSDLKQRTQVRIASTLAEGMMTFTVSLYLEQIRKQPSPEWLEEFTDSIHRTLARVSSMNPRGAMWLNHGEGLTQAGWDLMVALDYLNLRAPTLTWKAQYPELKEFFDLHGRLPELKKTAPPPA